jgi:hypothetical protein
VLHRWDGDMKQWDKRVLSMLPESQVPRYPLGTVKQRARSDCLQQSWQGGGWGLGLLLEVEGVGVLGRGTEGRALPTVGKQDNDITLPG